MITVVSGLPRSGTSLMMQMLAAGGMPILTDHLREPDEDNPQGYLEWEPAKRLRQEPQRIAEAEGMVVKVVSPLLNSLPLQYVYQVVFMHRPLGEMLRSQAEMMRRSATDSGHNDEELARAFERHLQQILPWLEQHPQFKLLRIGYPEVLSDPRTQAEKIRRFLDFDLDVEAMVRQVNPSLHRHRS